MNIDDIKTQWAATDRKLEASLRLNASLLREVRLDKARAALEPLTRFLLIEALLNFVAVFLLGDFIANHIREVRFVIPAVLLDGCAILLMAGGLHQFVALRSTDFSAPVVSLQKRLELLKRQRVIITKWTLLMAPLLWTPLLIVGLQALLGIDAYAAFPAKWLVANLLFGAAFIPAMLRISRRYADRWKGAPLVQQLLDDIAGRSLCKATAFLETLARFEQEDEDREAP
jgi:hypothetical protein